MEAREGYKKTELGWIPEDWEVKKLGDLLKAKPEYGANASAVQHISERTYRYIRITDINDDGKLNPNSIVGILKEDGENYVLKKYDLLIARTGNTVGKSFLYLDDQVDCSYAGYLIRFRIDKSKYNIFLLYHILHSTIFWGWVKSILRVGAQPNINAKEYQNFLIPLPPLPEQQKIAEILTTVDDKISSIEDRIQQTEQLKKGLMEKLLTEGIGHTEFKDTEIGRMPVSWDVVQIKDIGNVITGNTPPTSNKLNYNNGIRMWASPADLGLFKYVKETKTKISASGFEQTRKLPKNSLLITCIGSTIGKIGIAFEEMSSNQQINAIVCKDNHYDCDFYYYVISRISPKIKQLSATQAVPIINKTEFSNIVIPKAPFPEQKQIASILSTVDDKLDILHSKKSGYETLKKGLMEQLLTGKRRVKV